MTECFTIYVNVTCFYLKNAVHLIYNQRESTLTKYPSLKATSQRWAFSEDIRIEADIIIVIYQREYAGSMVDHRIRLIKSPGMPLQYAFQVGM